MSSERDQVCVFRDGVESCPGCGEKITYAITNGGWTVDITHRQPPCEAFRRFIERLVVRHDSTSGRKPTLA